jgi:hypothetical protein
MAMADLLGQPIDRGASPRRCGEVIAAEVTQFEAQCDRLHTSPPLGALVRVSPAPELAIFAVVASVATGGIEPGMRPIPRGRDGCEDADIFLAHPDLVHLLATTMRCLVLGFRQSGTIRRFLPPGPAPIHYSVAACPPAEVTAFTQEFSYFSTLLASRDLPGDEVLAAHVRYCAEARDLGGTSAEDPYAFSVRAGRTLALLLRGEQQRLTPILQHISRPRSAWEHPPDPAVWSHRAMSTPVVPTLRP